MGVYPIVAVYDAVFFLLSRGVLSLNSSTTIVVHTKRTCYATTARGGSGFFLGGRGDNIFSSNYGGANPYPQTNRKNCDFFAMKNVIQFVCLLLTSIVGHGIVASRFRFFHPSRSRFVLFWFVVWGSISRESPRARRA